MKKNRFYQLGVVMALLLSLSGCGASGASYAEAGAADYTENATEEAMTANGFDYEGYEEDEAKSESGENAGSDEAAKSTQKLVYTCDMSIDTKNYSEAKKSIRKLIEEKKGFIASETETNNDVYWYDEDADERGLMSWTVTVRIPPDEYQSFINALQEGKDSRVMSISSSVENISTRYHDKKTEIAALETEEKRLLEMMEKASTVEEMIQVESRLTEVETKLNQSKTDLSYMDSMVNYSTITLNLNEVRSYQAAPKPQTTFVERLGDTFVRSWRRFLNGCESLLFWFILNLPILVVLGVIFLVVHGVMKKRGKRLHFPKKKERPTYHYPPVDPMKVNYKDRQENAENPENSEENPKEKPQS